MWCLAPDVPRVDGPVGLAGGPLGDELTPLAGAVAPADLCRRAAVGEHDVPREVVLAADQRRADTIGIDRHALLLEGTDPIDREAAGGDDLHPLEPVAVQRVAHLAHEPLVDPARVEVAQLVPERPVDELARGIES